MYCNVLEIPNTCIKLHPGDIIKIGRFNNVSWQVGYGWYQFDGNRSICGWYVINLNETDKIKPITDSDIIDIYLVQR